MENIPYKLYDTFCYNGEEIALFHIQYLYDIVDKFIIVESRETHSGHIKPFLYFEQNSQLFEPYKDTIDIVFAGFPCQGFSRAGKKKASDPRNQMYQQFVRVSKVVQPSFIIGENVTQNLKTIEAVPLKLESKKYSLENVYIERYMVYMNYSK